MIPLRENTDSSILKTILTGLLLLFCISLNNGDHFEDRSSVENNELVAGVTYASSQALLITSFDFSDFPANRISKLIRDFQAIQRKHADFQTAKHVSISLKISQSDFLKIKPIIHEINGLNFHFTFQNKEVPSVC